MSPSVNLVQDPVCGMEVDIGTTFLTAKHDGKVYYFCSAGCQKAFEAEPGRYLGADYKPSMFGAMKARVRGLFGGART
jgi:Cu+-exporting ATPase